MRSDFLLEVFVHLYTLVVSYQLVQYDHSNHLMPCAIITILIGYALVGITRNSYYR